MFVIAGIDTNEFTFEDITWICAHPNKDIILGALGFTYNFPVNVTLENEKTYHMKNWVLHTAIIIMNEENLKKQMEYYFSKHYITMKIKILDDDTGNLFVIKRFYTFYEKEITIQIADFLEDGTYISYNKNNDTILGKDINNAYKAVMNYFVDNFEEIDDTEIWEQDIFKPGFSSVFLAMAAD